MILHFKTVSSFHLSAQVGRLHWSDLPFERLSVSASVAQDFFRDDDFKSQQIPFIVEQSRLKKAAAADSAAGEGEAVPFYPDGTVTCYRLGDHVDISSGILCFVLFVTSFSILYSHIRQHAKSHANVIAHLRTLTHTDAHY